MSELETAIALLISCFNKYAMKDGDNHSLSKGELKELLKNELGDLLGKTDDKEALEQIFKELDINKDNSVDFCEFGRMVFCLTMLCHELFSSKK